MKAAAPTFKTLETAESRTLLARHRVGRIAYALHDRIDIEPVHYVFDGDWLFGRTSMGTKLSTLSHHPWCAFEVDEVHALFDWTSVVAKGSFYLLDPEASTPGLYGRALDLLMTLIPETFSPEDPVPHRTILFGIYVQEITGRSATTGQE
ncbi:MAG TPA: pyridoxamine 5'-phosphate oxidase family protein [Gemmatimonadaceae bacterium]|nr:pyridoxamine 5'-phosphate oxidase family protein [Gemmatimonadaceae bacterium]